MPDKYEYTYKCLGPEKNRIVTGRRKKCSFCNIAIGFVLQVKNC